MWRGVFRSANWVKETAEEYEIRNTDGEEKVGVVIGPRDKDSKYVVLCLTTDEFISLWKCLNAGIEVEGVRIRSAKDFENMNKVGVFKLGLDECEE